MPGSIELSGLAGATLFLVACGSVGNPPDATPIRLAADSAVRSALAMEASLDPADFPDGSVGVMPLRVDALDPDLAPLGFGLAELLMSDLAKSSRLRVVDRLRIHALLREVALTNEGVVDLSSGVREGRLVGARHLVLGSVMPATGSDLLVDVDLVAAGDGSLTNVVTGSTSVDDILDAETELALALFDALGVALTPSEREAVVRRPTRDLLALLAFSRGVEAEAEGRILDAIDGYRTAIEVDPAFLEPRELLNSLETYFPDVRGVAHLMIDAINRPGLPEISDVTDPAFQDRQGAVLVIPIVIR
ncbi:MAG: hypothetical protein HKN71_05680 [Gemmatimonadetes bacterium]|nr:hypothetical protein [Gemmatimonadota bacterium]